MTQFQMVGRDRLAREIVQQFPSIPTIAVARRYVDEAWDAGLSTDQEVAEFALLMSDADRGGRPARIDQLVKDGSTHSQLKLFQLRYALYGEQP